jgi:hypothetical protein
MHMQRELHIRPLSEGIGLGSLKSVPPKPVEQFVPRVDIDAELPKVPDMESIFISQAHAAYAPQSVASEIRNRPTSKALVYSSRFLLGFGTDLLVGCLSVLILSWTGIIAWNAGSSNGVNPLDAWMTLINFLKQLNAKQFAVMIVIISMCWRLLRLGVSKI